MIHCYIKINFKIITKNIKLIKGDVRDYDLVKYYSKNCNSIFHLAAILGVDIVSEKNLETMDCEYEGLKNICKAAKNNKIKKVIYSSSSGVYGKLKYRGNVKENVIIQPASAYSMAKRSRNLSKYFYLETKISSIAVRLLMFMDLDKMKEWLFRGSLTAKLNLPLTVYEMGNKLEISQT